MKDEQLIKDLIKKGEGEQLEFKETVRKEDIAKSLCAFLNAQGGIVLIGVQDDGKVIGVKDADKQEVLLKNYLFNSIIPEAPITVTLETIGSKKIILAKVWNGSKPPYVFDHTIYFRKGSQTTKATSNDISKLIVERQKTELHWERQPAIGMELEDLDELEIRKTLKDLAQYGRGKVFSEKQVTEFLTYYGLFQNGNISNAAAVLFAKEPTRYLPQCRIRLVVFKESKSSDNYIHDRILEGNLFRNMEEILQFFDVNIATKSKFSDKRWHRIDTTFPKLALREGLMNALIHRDYSNVSGSLIIAFYPDHLEISNYGELPSELKPADLGKNHLSLPRNPDIAHICFLRQLIEKIGRGTLKMIEDCESKGYPKPKWQSKAGVTTLTFPGITVTAKTNDGVNDGVIDGVIDGVNKLIDDGVIDGVIDGVSDGVKKEIMKLVQLLIEVEGANALELSLKRAKSKPTMERYLRTAKKAGIIEFKGAPKTGGYYLSMKMKKYLK